jgi:dethiobiotin synthetase
VRGLFVTGTDTGVGKSVLSAALVAAMAQAGMRVRASKPVVTGLAEPPEARAGWPADHELLAGIAGMAPEEVSPLRLGAAASPHLAAELEHVRIEPAELVAGVRSAARDAEIVIVEGAGGLLVPLAPGYLLRDLVVELGLPLVIAARPGLGTINHTLLTLEAARAAGLDVRAVVLTPWPSRPDAVERSNRDTIAALGGVEVETLAVVEEPSAEQLARAGERLPWRRWIDRERGRSDGSRRKVAGPDDG